MVTWTSSGPSAARRYRGSTRAGNARLLRSRPADLLDLLPSGERYSYVFDGTAQTLDHMLVSESLRPLVSLFAYVRGNADSPEAWRSDTRRPERISDHDAALAFSLPLEIETNDASFGHFLDGEGHAFPAEAAGLDAAKGHDVQPIVVESFTMTAPAERRWTAVNASRNDSVKIAACNP